MGNASSASLPEKEHGDPEDNILHFEHVFNARLVDSLNVANIPMSPRDIDLADPNLGSGKVVRISMVADKITVEDAEVTLGKPKPEPVVATSFAEVAEVCWDHSHSSVKIVLNGEKKEGEAKATDKPPQHGRRLSLEGVSSHSNTYIFVLPNSLELETEFKLRLSVLKKGGLLASAKKPISFQYIGMFAGPTKPKPFQRKRANLSKIKAGTLPSLTSMKEYAKQQYAGTAGPVPSLNSRRLDIALQHIHQGYVTFPVTRASHTAALSEHSGILIDYESVKFCQDLSSRASLDLPFKSIAHWEVVDHHAAGSGENGLHLRTTNGTNYFFQVKWAVDVKHVLEFFWNTAALAEGLDPIPASTHGRIVEEMFNVTGSVPRPPIPVGSHKVTDSSGRVVCDLDPNGHQRRGSFGSSSPGGRRGSGTGAAHGRRTSLSGKAAPMERPKAKEYWNKVVLHQGWLLKKGGMQKKWIKRYFVLYRTCMGHILCYYSDYTETALYSETAKERNVIDCCKVEYIRPVSNTPDTPAFAFDIQSIQRQWTVCAADQADLQLWLKIVSHAVDADVGILPDDEAGFLVKPRSDPTMRLYLDEYSTYLRVHSWGVTVEVVEGDVRQKVFFWSYTDLYKWSILSQRHKIALQLTVFTTADYSKKTDFIFRTRDAPKIASTIEYYIEKFMCVMSLRLELNPPASAVVRSPASPDNAVVAGNNHAATDNRRASLTSQTAPNPPKSPLYRAHNDHWEDDDDEGANTEGADWASDGEDDERHEDFLSFDDEALGDVQRKNSVASPTSISLTSVTSPGASPVPSTPISPPPQPTPAQIVSRGISPSTLLQMEAWHTALIASNQGVLFENDTLQVLLRQEFNMHQGLLTLVYRNLSPTLPLDPFIATASSPTPGILIQAAPVQPRLSPGEQATQQLRVICMEPFQVGPSLQLDFTTAEQPQVQTRHCYPLPLPVSVLHFLTPLPMSRDTFMAQWNAVTVPEVMDTFVPPRPVHADAVSSLLASNFRMGPITELCYRNDSVQLITLACSLETGTLSPQGKQLRVGALVRLEVSVRQPACRLTIRAAHPACAAALFRAVKAQVLAV